MPIRSIRNKAIFGCATAGLSARLGDCGSRRRASQSRRAAAGRAELLAKRGPIGQMETPAELISILDASRMRPDASGF